MKNLFHLIKQRYDRSPIHKPGFLRKHIEKLHMRQIMGVNLASFAFVAAIIVPQTNAVSSEFEVMRETTETIVEIVPTIARFQWPLSRFGLTSRFSSGHPGLDLTDPKGTPIKSIAEGKVVKVESNPFGYGKHMLIEHDKGAKSLYAHLSKVEVKEGQSVDKNTVLGEVGSTGWSTGNHLHLEIYQDGTPVNPMDALPTIPSIIP
ncbi:MAG: M23 family metallopeptidase [Patescibacteria group bacterium]